MKMFLPFFAVSGALAVSAAAVNMQFVTVGNPGNAADPVDGDGYTPGVQNFGAVASNYQIGKYEVTISQYVEFLNAVAKTDTYSLFHDDMTTDLNIAGVLRAGISGNYVYSVLGSGQRPITYVTYLDALRFVNWMHNGQPTGAQGAGTTEAGAYTLNGDMSIGLELRNANAKYWMPNDSEWYKAAYYDPNKNGPGSGGYWLYPTKSNTAPGNVIGNLPNQANILTTVYSVTQTSTSPVGNVLTDAGAFTNSASAYGTYDQGGNVEEWTEGPYINDQPGLRGGEWFGPAAYLPATFKDVGSVTLADAGRGFRIATVPEPGVAASLALGGALLLGRRRR